MIILTTWLDVTSSFPDLDPQVKRYIVDTKRYAHITKEDVLNEYEPLLTIPLALAGAIVKHFNPERIQ